MVQVRIRFLSVYKNICVFIFIVYLCICVCVFVNLGKLDLVTGGGTVVRVRIGFLSLSIQSLCSTQLHPHRLQHILHI